MSRSIYMYLFFFSLLLVLFMYFNQQRIYDDQQEKIVRYEQKLQAATDSISSLEEQNLYLNYFTLLGNDNAMTYFEKQGYEAADIEQYVRESIYAYNEQEGNNPMVPYEGMSGEMKINKLKFLNHRWLIADFTDGQYWGEMVLEYFIEEDRKISFNTLGSLLYTN
ncbi:MAG: hydrolase [Gilvibacter sp.]